MPTPIIFNGFKYKMARGEANLFFPAGPHGEVAQAALYGTLFDKDLVYTPDKDMLYDDGGYYFDMGGGIKKYEMSAVRPYAETVELVSFTNYFKLIASDLVFPNVTLVDIRFVALWFSPGGLIGVWDTGINQSVSGADFVIKWDATGVLRII